MKSSTPKINMFKQSVVISAFSAASASVLMSAAFSSVPLYWKVAETLENATFSLSTPRKFELTQLLLPTTYISADGTSGPRSINMLVELILRLVVFALGVSLRAEYVSHPYSSPRTKITRTKIRVPPSLPYFSPWTRMRMTNILSA